MFVLEANTLLRGIICPACKKAIHLGIGSPFRKFNALEVTHNKPAEECQSFNRTLGEHFNAYESGEISAAELQTWLDKFRDSVQSAT